MATKTKQNRAETERRLIDAALDLIRRNGVLAGLNLREVADGAGVNRGNIYHYFGSRRELLRAAITRRFEAVVESLLADRRGASFVERRLRTFRSTDTSPGQPTARPARHRRGRHRRPDAAIRGGAQRLRQDVIDGDIDRAHDLEALQVALSALLRGYRIFREPYAKRIDTDVDDLDKRIAEIVRTWLEAVAEPPATS